MNLPCDSGLPPPRLTHQPTSVHPCPTLLSTSISSEFHVIPAERFALLSNARTSLVLAILHHQILFFRDSFFYFIFLLFTPLTPKLLTFLSDNFALFGRTLFSRRPPSGHSVPFQFVVCAAFC